MLSFSSGLLTTQLNPLLSVQKITLSFKNSGLSSKALKYFPSVKFDLLPFLSTYFHSWLFKSISKRIRYQTLRRGLRSTSNRPYLSKAQFYRLRKKKPLVKGFFLSCSSQCNSTHGFSEASEKKFISSHACGNVDFKCSFMPLRSAYSSSYFLSTVSSRII